MGFKCYTNPSIFLEDILDYFNERTFSPQAPFAKALGLSGLYATKLCEAMVASLRYGGHDPNPGTTPICRFLRGSSQLVF